MRNKKVPVQDKLFCTGIFISRMVVTGADGKLN